MDVSIIIVNYNTMELTSQCVDSILKYTSGLSYEIIIVDNASNDDSVNFFSKDKAVKLISLPENLGFGKANNIGMSVAEGDYIFFLNSDTYLKNNAVKFFHDFYKKNDIKIAALGCLLEDINGNNIHSYGKFPTISRILISCFIPGRFKKCILGKDYKVKYIDKYFEVEYVTGADIFIDKKILRNLGAFDPDFFMYSEETELQFRFQKMGYRNMIIKTPSIVHLEGMSNLNKNEIFSIEKLLMAERSQFLYFKKTETIFKYYLFRLLYLCIRFPKIFFLYRPWFEKKLLINSLLKK